MYLGVHLVRSFLLLLRFDDSLLTRETSLLLFRLGFGINRVCYVALDPGDDPSCEEERDDRDHYDVANSWDE